MLEKMQFRGRWRDYQARVLAEMDPHMDDARLHVVAAPGAGKTVLGLEILRRIGRPGLVFAPTIAIREQWAERLCPLFLDAPPDPGCISRDLGDCRKLTLSTYQALDALRRGEDLDALIDKLNAHGPLTLVLDEAHHLRREWWKCLVELAKRLTDVRLVALTATPPYDASFAEWTRYEELCGPIDLEIGIPELVRNGDLCPHQDHLILSEPGAAALALLEERRAAIGDLQRDLRADDGLLDWLAVHPWLIDPEAHVEAILEAPEMLSAALVLLASSGRTLPKAPLKLLGVSARDVPLPSLFWLERLLDGLMTRHKDTFLLDAARLKSLRDSLHRQGLIEGGRVRLRQTRSVFQLMTSNLAKLESITAIVRAESQALGDGLRMVVLSDHIRASELPPSPAAPFKPAKLGVVPIFETLRRSGCADRLALLTGSLVFIPRGALAVLPDAARGLQLDPEGFRTADIPACPDYLRLETRSGGSADLVRLVTALFAAGEVRIVVGTQSLLGEGWDAPVLNSLVLASNAASFMLSNQMRGRAIRIDPAAPDKVANIWHLATIDPYDRSVWNALATAFDWGAFNDDGAPEVTDIGVVGRRFRAFEGIANGGSTLIENGIARLGIDPDMPGPRANARSFAIAAERPAIAQRWQASLGEGTARSHVHETIAPTYSPRVLSWHDTLQALSASAAGSGALAGANEVREIASFEGLRLIGMGIAGVMTLASLPPLIRAGRLIWRNGSLEGSLVEVTRVLLRALSDAGAIGGAEAEAAEVEIRTSLDGRRDVILTGVSRAAERQVMRALAECLGPVQNPRYLLVRASWFGLKRRVDYHAVPTVLGARKEDAERFTALWRAHVGSSRLVFARTPEGRRTLLRARAQSFAAGFQRRVGRRSVWL
jgi:Type III restriction enzyme, res subunit